MSHLCPLPPLYPPPSPSFPTHFSLPHSPIAIYASSFFSFLSLLYSLITHFQFASPLFPPLFVFLRLTRAHVSAVFSSSLTSASSLLLLLLTVLHHFLLPSSSPFYLSLFSMI